MYLLLEYLKTSCGKILYPNFSMYLLRIRTFTYITIVGTTFGAFNVNTILLSNKPSIFKFSSGPRNGLYSTFPSPTTKGSLTAFGNHVSLVSFIFFFLFFFFYLYMKFIVKLVSIQHPVLIPKGALLSIHHPPSPPSHPPSTLSLFSVLNSLLCFGSLPL